MKMEDWGFKRIEKRLYEILEVVNDTYFPNLSKLGNYNIFSLASKICKDYVERNPGSK